MKITHRLITKKPRCMRYIDCADWYQKDGVWDIVAADTGTRLYNFLLIFHELVELTVCEKRGITQEQVDEFDMNYKGRYEEYGCDPKAPYHKEHMFAIRMEKMLCKELGLKWDDYLDAVDCAFAKVKKAFKEKNKLCECGCRNGDHYPTGDMQFYCRPCRKDCRP